MWSRQIYHHVTEIISRSLAWWWVLRSFVELMKRCVIMLNHFTEQIKRFAMILNQLTELMKRFVIISNHSVQQIKRLAISFNHFTEETKRSIISLLEDTCPTLDPDWNEPTTPDTVNSSETASPFKLYYWLWLNLAKQSWSDHEFQYAGPFCFIFESLTLIATLSFHACAIPSLIHNVCETQHLATVSSGNPRIASNFVSGLGAQANVSDLRADSISWKIQG